MSKIFSKKTKTFYFFLFLDAEQVLRVAPVDLPTCHRVKQAQVAGHVGIHVAVHMAGDLAGQKVRHYIIEVTLNLFTKIYPFLLFQLIGTNYMMTRV